MRWRKAKKSVAPDPEYRPPDPQEVRDRTQEMMDIARKAGEQRRVERAKQKRRR